MKDGPNIARVASAIGEPARAEMLAALMSGQGLTATELADVAGVTKPTPSAAKVVVPMELSSTASPCNRIMRRDPRPS